MNLIEKNVQAYAEAHTTPERKLLAQLSAETYASLEMPQMLSGHLQGAFLSMLSRMVRPRAILEIGTYSGYSAICLADGLAENGHLHTIEIEPHLRDIAVKYIEKAGLSNRISCQLGDALEIIPTIDESFDLVFLDADKANYCRYYDLVFPKVRQQGFIVADNVLWSGKVLGNENDAQTRGLVQYNKKIQADDRIYNVLAPIRDGLMIVQKISE